MTTSLDKPLSPEQMKLAQKAARPGLVRAIPQLVADAEQKNNPELSRLLLDLAAKGLADGSICSALRSWLIAVLAAGALENGSLDRAAGLRLTGIGKKREQGVWISAAAAIANSGRVHVSARNRLIASELSDLSDKEKIPVTCRSASAGRSACRVWLEKNSESGFTERQLAKIYSESSIAKKRSRTPRHSSQ